MLIFTKFFKDIAHCLAQHGSHLVENTAYRNQRAHLADGVSFARGRDHRDSRVVLVFVAHIRQHARHSIDQAAAHTTHSKAMSRVAIYTCKTIYSRS